MQSAVSVLTLALLAATPAQADRFAIRCKGERLVAFMLPGTTNGMMSGERGRGDVTYIVDEEARTVHEIGAAADPIELCSVRVPCQRSFSADQIVIEGDETSDQERRTVWFDWERRTGKLETGFDVVLTNGAVMTMRMSLKCAPVSMRSVTWKYSL